jgi:serine/threonine protein kinase
VPIPFGKYQLQRKLAEGGMAEVFLGRQAGMEGFEKLVVLKRIRPELSSDQNFVNMFLNEARVAARLNHPNIVQIFELGKVESQYFIAMEFIHGEDLRSLTRQSDAAKRHVPAGLVCRIIADTLAGLHYAHTRPGADGKQMGLVHRDVSPQNVLVTYEGGVKLVDFGIAKATRSGLTEQTRAGLFKGKFAYMSPEQSRGQPLDARSDIFAVGILLWELLTWTRLFKRANDMATLIAVAEEEIPSPLSFDPKLPAELERIAMKALHRKTHMRYTTAQEMRADLEALIRSQGWEGDALALQTYMHETFADKLRRQEEDIRESGFGSLEDFLLTVDEKSTVSWIKSVNVKTPSSGLPPSPAPLPGLTKAAKIAPVPLQHVDPIGHTQELGPLDMSDSGGLDLSTGEPTELPGEATSFSAMPVFDDEHRPGPAARKIGAEDLGTADTSPVTEVPQLLVQKPKPAAKPLFSKRPEPAPPPETKQSAARTLLPDAFAPQSVLPVPPAPAPAELNALPTAIVSRPSDLPSLPTAIVAPPVQKTAAPAPSGGPSETVQLSPAVFGPDQVTLLPGKVSPLPAEMLAMQPGGVMPAVAFPTDPTLGNEMPVASPYFPSASTTAPRPIVDPPAKRRWPIFAVGGVVLAVGITLFALRGGPAVKVATLDINLDQPAVIAVDGKAQPPAQRLTVQVTPGVAHVVTVERDGKVLRTINIPTMQPNEEQQVNVIIR